MLVGKRDEVTEKCKGENPITNRILPLAVLCVNFCETNCTLNV